MAVELEMRVLAKPGWFGLSETGWQGANAVQEG
jgi:hypothetical protein